MNLLTSHTEGRRTGAPPCPSYSPDYDLEAVLNRALTNGPEIGAGSYAPP